MDIEASYNFRRMSERLPHRIEPLENWTKPLRGRPEGRSPCHDVFPALVCSYHFFDGVSYRSDSLSEIFHSRRLSWEHYETG